MNTAQPHLPARRLEFIIVGASVAGLASAIALKKSGHNVVVLEKQAELGHGGGMPFGCVRLPPNGSKILYDWGLEEQMREHAIIADGFAAYRYEGNDSGRDLLGIQRWDPEFLSEARGNFLHFWYRDLVQLLFEEAIRVSPAGTAGTAEIGASHVDVRFSSEVVEIDGDDAASARVTLRSGEVLEGDAVIGADGVLGVAREMLMREEACENAHANVQDLGGITFYGATVAKSLVAEDPGLASFFEHPQNVFMGSNRGAYTFTMGKEQHMSLCVLIPDAPPNSTKVDGFKMTNILGPCDAGIRKLAALAGPPIRVARLQEPYQLQSWVSQSGRVLVLGEAAHPFPPVSLHKYSVALEDAAFVGKIFSHTSDRARVPEFLYAFQEHREERCTRIRDIEIQYIEIMTMPEQETRDSFMRANHAVGRNVLDTPGSAVATVLDETTMVFGYEPADDADEWWVTWGRFHGSQVERSLAEDGEDFDDSAFRMTEEAAESCPL